MTVTAPLPPDRGRSKPLSVWAFRIAFGIVALFGLYMAGWRTAVNLPQAHMDGAFQTASTLHRLAGGELPGRDFLPYLGLGSVYGLYPVYKASGGTMAASVATAKFVTLVACLLAIWTTFALIFPRRVLVAGAAAAIAVSAAALLESHLPRVGADLLSPGVSLRPYRAAVVYLTVWAAWGLARSHLAALARCVGFGVLAATAFNWSNDFGIPSAAIALGLGAYVTRREGSSLALYLLVAPVAAALWAIALGMLATGGHWFDLLRYNFVDVRHDQWWFFGPWWDPAYRLLNIMDLPKLFVLPFPALPLADRINFPLIIGLVAVATSLLIALRTRAVHDVLLASAGLGLLGGLAIVDAGGSIIKSYGLGLVFWSLLAFVGWSLRAVRAWSRPLWEDARALCSKGELVASLAALIAMIGIASLLAHGWWSEIKEARQSPDRFFVPELGGWLPADWRTYVETARSSPSNRDVIEEYWGLWSAITGAHAKMPVDSVIHALGSVRPLLAAALARGPAWVITTQPAEAGHWWSWNVSASWGFYKRVIENYEPVAYSPRTIVWHHRTPPAVRVEVPCRVEAMPLPHMEIMADRPGYYGATLRYRMRRPPLGRTLLLAHNNLNSSGGGFVSLDPNGDLAEFPVAVEAGGTTRVGFVDAWTLASPASDELRLSGCTAERFEVPSVFPPPRYPKDTEILAVDEGAFRNGVDLGNRTIVLPYSIEGVRRFVPGTAVCLADQRRRVIHSVKLLPEPRRQLAIALDGPPLTGDLGSPNELLILAPAPSSECPSAGRATVQRNSRIPVPTN